MVDMAIRRKLIIIFGIIGFSLFFYATDLIATLGLFLILTANNIEHSIKRLYDFKVEK